MIRFANKFDNKTIWELLKDFCYKKQFNVSLDESEWSEEFVNNRLSMIYAGLGFVLIAKDGILVAVKNPCFWLDNVFVLQEIMWHSKTTKTAVALLEKFIEIGKEMVKSGEVREIHFASFGNADFSKYGAVKHQTAWKI
jgi:hypothetical protein